MINAIVYEKEQEKPHHAIRFLPFPMVEIVTEVSDRWYLIFHPGIKDLLGCA